MKSKINLLAISIAIFLASCSNSPKSDYTVRIDDNVRAEQIKEMKWGMFICWSFSTFYGSERTPILDKDASYFKATGVM